MDPHKRPRSHTTPENGQCITVEHGKFVNSVSNETDPNNQTSSPPESPTLVNNTSGKSWLKFFGNQHTKQTSSENCNNCSELDLSYITPRLIVITTPRDNLSDVSSRSTLQLIHNVLNTKHPNSYMIYTLDQSSNDQLSYRTELFHNRIVDLPLFDEKQLPRLVFLLWFCQKITSYLLESALNVVVLHCIDERNQLAFGACSLLAYHRIFAQVEQIIEYYQLKRSTHLLLTMSQKRYIQYLCDLSFNVIERPHFNELILKAIDLSPVPLVNRQKTGCRPFVDIYDQDYNKIFSTYEETAKLRVYSASDSNCVIPINLPFNGDLMIHITHATIGHLRQTHEGGIRICEFAINPNFSTLNHPELSYLRNELDGIDHNDKNATLFRVTIQITNSSKATINEKDVFTEQLEKTSKQPLALFGNENQFEKSINDFEKQVQQQNHDVNGKHEVLSSDIQRRRKSKDESTSSHPISPTSPQNKHRYSVTLPLSSQSVSSFINPRHSLFKQQIETNQQSSTLMEENNNNNKTIVATLLDFGDDNFNNDSGFERSFSSDIQQQQFNSQTNLLDDDFNSDKSVLKKNSKQTILPPPILATTILKPEQKSPTSTKQSNQIPTTNTPNYNLNIITNNVSSSQPQSNPKPSTNQAQKPKIDIYQYFNDIGVLKKDSKPQSEPSVPHTIGAAQKAALAKDVDPTVLKIREWSEGKKGNLRALLSSLSNITWPECQWTGCQMNELITHEQVKKAYRKALINIHPDKFRGDPNEPLAKLIFVELNEAWSQFEKELN